ncbi:MAG: phosphodiester glycosidase family protein [Oscillospiraceae bacterium]|nr:phosphodiester glycosidase family protein [Oscillospiraceae bacterium]
MNNDPNIKRRSRRRKRRKKLVALVVLNIVLLAACIVLAASLLKKPSEASPSPAPLPPAASSSSQESEVSYPVYSAPASPEAYLQAAKDKALSDLPIYPVHYSIPAGRAVGYVPNPECYGTLGSIDELEQLLSSPQARNLLDGQETLLTPDTELVNGTRIRYYLDDSILVLIWNEALGKSFGTFCEVKVSDASQFRRKIVNDTYGAAKYITPTELSAQVNAVAAASGDMYDHFRRKIGVSVYEGQIMRYETSCDTCFITSSGNLILKDMAAFSSREQAQQFVEENGIQFSLCFGPILILDGENVAPARYPYGEANEDYPRMAISQLGELHYLTVAANTDRSNGLTAWGCTVQTLAETLLSRGLTNAYTLDGGQTATIVLNHQTENPMLYSNGQQIVSDIVYFATAVPNE